MTGPEPTCFRCGKTATEVGEYDEYAKEEGMSVADWVRREEGTYNPERNQFCCTECYITIGMPSRPGRGWRVP